VCDQGTSKNEEAKARYRAVKNTTTMCCNGRKAKTNIFMNFASLNTSSLSTYTRLSTASPYFLGYMKKDRN
jgi:hypothetical protein